MRNVNIDGVTVIIEQGKALPPHPISKGRKKGPIRLLCEQLREGESALIPATAKTVDSANLHNIGKALGAQFRYRTEGKGVRIYCVAGPRSARSKWLEMAAA